MIKYRNVSKQIERNEENPQKVDKRIIDEF